MFARPGLLLGLSVAALFFAPKISNAQYFDDLNGNWTVTLDGQSQGRALTESYAEIGVRLRLGDKVLSLTRSGDTLILAPANTPGIVGTLNNNPSNAANSDVKLDIKNLDTKDQADDQLVGTYFGKKAVFKRDTSSKPPIVVKLPGDRPWVRFMQEILIPKSAEDRETYHKFNANDARFFLRSCQLYRTGYWQSKYMAGSSKAEQAMSFDRVVIGMNGALVSARSIPRSRFSPILTQNLSAKAKPSGALALSSLGMYFSTAAGGAVRIEVTDNKDSVIYYITDRRANSKNGLVVMKTPTHAPLASSFGKWLLDFSDSPKADDTAFAQALIETLLKSSSKAANKLSPMGRSAYTDYLGVMAIEDQRGEMFNNSGLSWGYNMSSGSFAVLISRALSHGQTRTGPTQLGSKTELASQVIVEDWSGTGSKLQPGNASYFDVLNGADNVLEGTGKSGGNDFQEYGGMSTMKKLTTAWLREKYAAKVKRVEAAFQFIPAAEVSSRAKEDIFHLICENSYDKRVAKITPAQANEGVAAVVDLMKTVFDNSRDLEAYMLSHGVTKSTDWAPRASGY